MFQVELIIKRENTQQNQIITFFFMIFVGIALAFMGLDLDMQVILSTMKVKLWHTNSKSLTKLCFLRNRLDLQLECFANSS